MQSVIIAWIAGWNIGLIPNSFGDINVISLLLISEDTRILASSIYGCDSNLFSFSCCLQGQFTILHLIVVSFFF